MNKQSLRQQCWPASALVWASSLRRKSGGGQQAWPGFARDEIRVVDRPSTRTVATIF